MSRSYTNHEEALIVRLYNEGESDAVIAAAVKSTPMAICMKLRRFRESRRISPRVLKRRLECDKIIIRLYNAGASRKEIADAIGVVRLDTVTILVNRLVGAGRLERRQKAPSQRSNLSPSETKALEQLTARPGSVVSVSPFIAFQLRSKVPHIQIENVKGEGYRLV